VELTLRKFKCAIDVSVPNNADLLMDIMQRSDAISNIQNRLARKRASERMRNSANDDVETPRGYGSIV
jgi:hypothetical protein